MIIFLLCCSAATLALLALAASFVVPRDSPDGHPRRAVRFWAAGGGVVALLLLFFASWTTVGTKNVAVLTTFGRPTGYLDNGFHWKAPWQTPHEISDAVQTDTYASDPENATQPQGGATNTCVHVRIERQAVACVNVSIRWQIRPEGVDYLYRNFKSNDHITDNVVLRDLQQAMNIAFSSYDPLGVDASGNNTNPPLTDYSDKITTQMRSEIGRWIDVQSVIIPLLNYDPDTQKKVQQLLQQIALTRVAQQAKQTAKAQAAANKALAASVSKDPNVLVSKCLDILKEVVDKGGQLPAGFSCFGPKTPVSVAVK